MTNHLYYGDNLAVLRDRTRFPDAFVDLIYLDPPFNSNASFPPPPIPEVLCSIRSAAASPPSLRRRSSITNASASTSPIQRADRKAAE
jgi:hypothetical protein